jgi:hypothetical protein
MAHTQPTATYLPTNRKLCSKTPPNEHVRILAERLNIRYDEQGFQPKNIVLIF